MPTPLTPIHKRYYQPGALAAALKKKFRRPEDALVALGLDPGLIKLGFDAQPEELKRQLVSRDQVPFAGGGPSSNLPTRRMNGISDQGPNPHRRGIDQDPMVDEDPDQEQPAEEEQDQEEEDNQDQNSQLIDQIMQRLAPHLSPEDADECRQMFHDALHRLAQDDPLPFSGRPQVGGGQDPIVPQKFATDQRGPSAPHFTKSHSFDAGREVRQQALDAALKVRVDTMGCQPRSDPGLWGELRRPTKPRQPRQATSPGLAMDATAKQSFHDRFPGIGRIRVL
jgi:hypothetical protein